MHSTCPQLSCPAREVVCQVRPYAPDTAVSCLDEREARRQPVLLDGRGQLVVWVQRQQRLRVSGAVPLAEEVRQPRRQRGLLLV